MKKRIEIGPYSFIDDKPDKYGEIEYIITDTDDETTIKFWMTRERAAELVVFLSDAFGLKN